MPHAVILTSPLTCGVGADERFVLSPLASNVQPGRRPGQLWLVA